MTGVQTCALPIYEDWEVTDEEERRERRKTKGKSKEVSEEESEPEPETLSPPSLQSVTSSASDIWSGSLSSDCSSFRAHSLPRSFLDCDAHMPSVSSFLIFACEHNGSLKSFSTNDSMVAAATRFGTNGKVTNPRAAPSGVVVRRLRQIGQSTDSCQPPQARCKREKNHLRMQRAQNV